MWIALRQRWFGAPRPGGDVPPRCAPARVSSRPEDPVVSRPPEPPAPVSEASEPAASDADIVRGFSARLLAAQALFDEPPSAIEEDVLERLREAASAGGEAPQLPRLPSVLPRVMGLIRRDDMAVRELAELLARDPALLGEVMRIAASPFYLGTQAPASLDAAIARLGQRGLHEVVSRAAMAPVFDLAQGRFGAAAGTLLREQAEACAHACAARCRGRSEPFDAYLAGMVANTGLIVALRLLDRHAPGTAPVSRVFHDRLAVLSARLSARIARQWRLPEAVALAVESLALPADGPPPSELAAALRWADRASKAAALARPRDTP